MSDWGQVTVTASGAQLVTAGGGPVLLTNTDQANSIWLTDDKFDNVAGDNENGSMLAPLASVGFDGSGPVWGFALAGSPAVVTRFPGGGNFFQLVELLVKTLLISGAISNGVFVYSGAAGAGDLAESISALASQDPFHNTCFPGFTSYTGNGPLDLFMSLTQAGLAWGTNQNGPGGSGALAIAGPVSARIQNTLLATDPVAGPPTSETWHSIPLAAGWSTVAGQMPPAYRLLPDGNVQITGTLTHASFATNIQINSAALPTAYRPINNYIVSGNLEGDAVIQVNNAGVINAELGTLASATTCRFNGTYPLNN